MLSDGDFQVELHIFEAGTPPQLRVYASKDGRLVDPATYELASTFFG